MSVQYKGGVNFDVIPQIRQAVSIAEAIFSRYGYVLFINSARDSTHKIGSLHYIGAAVDFRSKGLPSNVKQSIFSELKAKFPLPTWWTDLEDLGTSNEHFHIEYKPAKYSEADPYSVEPEDILTSYLPTDQDNIFFPSGEPPIDQPYPRYPSGTVPPQYFTPYEQPIDWKILLMAAFGIYLLIELTD
jgi:hypothetical protein